MDGRFGDHVRGCDDNLRIDELLVELRAFTFLVGSGDESVTLVLEPFAEAQLVFGRT